MSITIAPVFDPLSDSATQLARTTPLIIMQSDAGRMLRHELARYCAGEISGRSFLIAGHRGAGKTTMVADALRRVIEGLQPLHLRPLPVYLHGPSLFETVSAPEPASPDPKPAATAAKHARRRAAAQKSAEDESDAERLARRALVQIILGLHRAMTKEFSSRYRVAHSRHVNSAELAAQFEIELLEDPSAARLRELYLLAGAVNSGVLFPALSGRELNGQGARELTALNGICNAHQRISGDLRRTEKEQEKQSSERIEKRVIEIKGAEVFKPIAAVLAGAAVAGGAATAKGFGPGTAILGVLVTLAASFVINRSDSRTSKHERTTDTAFIPDLSLRTLDRLMPVLLDRLHDAGLAPVMIIDELDKVDGLSTRIVSVIDCLKKLMAEGVFSCFVTDRSYIEHLRIADRERAYAKAYSYFSHTLMTSYQPADFDAYLSRLLEISSPAGNADELDRDVLKWVLRRRCELHAMRLNREIASMRGEQNVLLFPGGQIRSLPAPRMDLTFQVVIELELLRPDLQAWLARRPTMLQTVYDALYFLPTHLMDGNTQLIFELNSTRKAYETATLRDWLEKRMNLAESGHTSSASSMALNEDDMQMCQTIIHNIASMLATRARQEIAADWLERSAEAGVGGRVTQPSPLVLGEMLLESEAMLTLQTRGTGNETHDFQWQRFSSGAPRATDSTGIQRQLQEARDFVRKIDKIEADLHTAITDAKDTTHRLRGRLLEWLADIAYVLDTTPSWKSVLDSMRDVEKERPDPGEISLAVDNIRRYHQMLVGANDRIQMTFQSAAFLAGLGSVATGRSGMEEAILLLSTALRFREVLPQERAIAVRDFQVQSMQRHPSIRWGRHDAGISMVGEATAAGREFSKGGNWGLISATAWDQVFLRVQNFVRTGKDRRAEVAEILSAAHGAGPTRTIPIDLASVTLSGWTSVLLAPLVDPDEPVSSIAAPFRDPPLWVAALALRQLGIASLGAEWADRFRSFLQHQQGWAHGQARITELLDDSLIWDGEASATASLMLIIRRSAGSETDKFLATPKRGLALVMTANQMNQLQRVAPLLQVAGETPWMIVWEQPSDSDGDRDELRKSLESREQKFTNGWLYPSQGPDLQEPCVVKPMDADEVFSVLGSASIPPIAAKSNALQG